MSAKLKSIIIWAVVLVGLAIIPQVFGIVKTNTVVELGISAMFAVSLNLLLSFTGLLSFGHALFFGAGAYATALLLQNVNGFPLVPAVLAGGLAAAVIAAICSPLLVRVSGTAFAMLTMAFGQLMFVLCLKFREITGGEDGIAGFPIPPFKIPFLLSVDMTVPSNFYYFAISVLGLSILAMWFLTKTPFGSLMVGIRDNADRVDYLGFKLAPTKAIIFLISGFFAGIAGSIFALFQNVVSTDGVLHILVSFTPLMAVLVGGIGTFFGPILGSAVLLFVEEMSMAYTERVELVAGLVFVGIVLFLPGGFMYIYVQIKAKLAARSAGPAAMEKAS
ncbi:MAG: branched-chain amino acid ABC transporter permease [Proteobacteria bacterium]|nr:branched-chain amino acid ABC transporter permease [Pseudomonadota bacterium]